MKVDVTIVIGTARGGTSWCAERLIEEGYVCPRPWCSSELTAAPEYETYETCEYAYLSRNWDAKRALAFANSINSGEYGERVVLKYPSAIKQWRKWLALFPQARIVYVYRPMVEVMWAWRRRGYDNESGGMQRAWIPMQAKLAWAAWWWLITFVKVWCTTGHQLEMRVFNAGGS